MLKNMNKGQSLFEVVIALAISALIIVTLVALVSAAIRNSTFSKNKTLAARYAQDATEWLRGERDTDWDALSSRSSAGDGITWCLTTLAWPASAGSCSGNFIGGTEFEREITLSYPNPLDPSNIQADISIKWSDSQGEHEVRSATNFGDWRER